jgi:hypothetical protein
MASIDHNKGNNEKPHLMSPDVNSGSVHILKSSHIGIDSDFTHSVDLTSPNQGNYKSLGGKPELTTQSVDVIH